MAGGEAQGRRPVAEQDTTHQCPGPGCERRVVLFQQRVIDRLRDRRAHAVEQAAYWERTAAQIDETLGVKIDRIAGERDASRAEVARLRTALRDLRDAHAAHEEAEADVLRALFDVEQSDEDDTDAYDAAVVARDAAAERLGTAWAAAQRELDGEAEEESGD